MLSFRLDGLDWQDRVNPVNGTPYQSARVVRDAATGAEAIFVRYPPGSLSPAHRHPCAHGLLVIRGRLETQGGAFHPGDLVWYAEGEAAWHGAGKDVEAVALIISNKRFEVEWLKGDP